jgi:hypothetical protein
VNDDHDDPLRALDREATPPPHLKARVTATLGARGLLRRGASTRRWVAAAAAAVVLFAAGLALGRRMPAAAQDRAGPRFALLLYEDSTFDRGVSEHTYVAEYSAWAKGLRASGNLEGGTALASLSQVLHAASGSVQVYRGDVASSAGVMAGFFVIRAASEAEALTIARTCPHLRHGGRIALRPVVPTS